MGRVFTLEELDQGQVPFHDRFASLAELIRVNSTDQAFILAALVYGSYLKRPRQDFNCRSDLNVLAIYDHSPSRMARRKFAHWYEYARCEHVPLSLITVDQMTAINGGCPVSPTWLNELRWAQENGGVLLGSVSDFLDRPTIDAKTDFVVYVTRELAKLERDLNRRYEQTETERCATRSRALSSPLHAVRKLLQVRDLPCIGLEKHQLIEFVRESTSVTLANMLTEISMADAALTTATHLVFQDHGKYADVYTDALREVDKVVPLAHLVLWRLANDFCNDR